MAENSTSGGASSEDGTCGKCYEGNYRLLAELVLSSSQQAKISHCCLNQALFTSVDILLIFTTYHSRNFISGFLCCHAMICKKFKQWHINLQDKMEETPPSHPSMAWVEDGGSQKSSSPADPCQMIVVDPLQTAHSSAWGPGTFPTMPCSGMAAPLLGTLQLGATQEGHARGLCMGWTESRSSSAPSCCQTFSSPPCSTPLLDVSWLQISREEEEVVDSIQILASNLSQVPVASWMATVPASAGRGLAAGGVLDRAGQSCCFHMALPLRTPVLLAICLPFLMLSDVKCKITLLYKIMDLCINTVFFGSSQRLIDFCRRYDLVERIQVLLEDEPWYQLSTELRQVAMLTIEILRAQPCPVLQAALSAADCQLLGLSWAAWASSPDTGRVSEELQSILQVWPGQRVGVPGLFLTLKERCCPLVGE
ncbi:hypothetical protein Nmel_000959 [Mimus melanotis]